MRLSQRGFTLVELIVVIVILGILAATALPRFINVQGDARTAAVGGIAGGLRAAVAVVQAKWMSTGADDATVTMQDGTVVSASGSFATMGLPENTANGIIRAMNCESSTACQGIIVGTIGADAAAGIVTPSTWRTTNNVATCEARYHPGSALVVSTTTTGC